MFPGFRWRSPGLHAGCGGSDVDREGEARVSSCGLPAAETRDFYKSGCISKNGYVRCLLLCSATTK